jgi:hypothetical protein
VASSRSESGERRLAALAAQRVWRQLSKELGLGTLVFGIRPSVVEGLGTGARQRGTRGGHAFARTELHGDEQILGRMGEVVASRAEERIRLAEFFLSRALRT